MEDIKHYKCRNVQEQVAYNSKRIDDLKEDVDELKEHTTTLEFNVEIPDGATATELENIKANDKYYIFGEPKPKIDIDLFQVTAYTDGPYVDWEEGSEKDIEITELNDSLRKDLISLLEKCLDAGEGEYVGFTANIGFNEETGEYTFLLNKDIETSEPYDDFCYINDGELFIGSGLAFAEASSPTSYELWLEISRETEEGESAIFTCTFTIEDPDDAEPYIGLLTFNLGW